MRTLSFVLACAAAAPAQESEATLPLSEVVLFTSGVGYFQRDGTVEGAARLELRFDAADVNDLLKSLVLRDLDGGQVSSVTYDSRDPVARALKSFAIDLTGEPSVGQVLRQVRGERVEIAAPDRLAGVLLGVETRRTKVGEQVLDTEFVNVLTDQGLRSVPLDQVQQLRFARADLDRELRQALAVLAAGNDTARKTVLFRFQGEGRRRVRVGYIRGTPVWKTSYRLVLGEGDAPVLQGWAIVENMTDEDWADVNLTLVSGRPISFVMDLYQPLYAPRPEVELELHAAVRPPLHEEAMDKAVERKAGKDMGAIGIGGGRARRALAAEPDAGFAGGVPAAAEGGEVGELFRYAIASPVTLARQKSALLPIVHAAVVGEKVSIYNERVHAKHPLNGVKLRNTSGLHLMQGPITVFDEGVYAGDARIDDLPPQGERLLSYALDLDTEVEAVEASAPASLLSVRLAKGTLISTRLVRREKTYRAKSRGAKARQVLVEHPFEADWTLLGPEPTERARDVYRFAVPVPAGQTKEVVVREERRLEQSVALSGLADDAVQLYLRAPVLSPAVKEALSNVLARKQELARTDAGLREGDRRVAEIEKEQERIRQNMGRLAQNSPLHARYVKTFADQEDELGRIREAAAGLRETRARQQEALDAYLMSLDLE